MPTANPPPTVVTYNATVSPETEAILAAMRQAVAEAQDRKRRLDQYAVFWQDGKVVRVEAKDLPALP